MPYKIYTYSDPYRIADTDFWNEIKSYPHFCAARTLVNGLISVMGNDIVSLMCPLDDIVNNRIYRDWANDIGLRINQYNELGEWYSLLYSRNELNDFYYSALKKNKNSMLDSIRLFIELDILPDALDVENLNYEHRMFVYMLKLAKKDPAFTLPQMPDVKGIKNILIQQAEYEKEEKEKKVKEVNSAGILDNKIYEKEMELFDRMIDSANKWDGQHVVVHGIHQFTPLQLRFIKYLDELGIEVVFLYNYLHEFKEIYSSWNYIYQQFDVEIHHDSKVKTYYPVGQLKRPGNALASNIGMLCDGNVSRTDKKIKENYILYKDTNVREYDNISEFAGFISDEFLKAEEKTNTEEKNIFEKKGTAQVLARMDKVIYTANKNVDDLLQVYHPEYSRARHFLAYPIGQFFSALYALWNIGNGEINIDFNLLRESLNSGILTKYNSESLLKTLLNLEPLFYNITTFTEFKDLFEKYKEAYISVSKLFSSHKFFSLREINIYDPNKVTLEEIDKLYNAIVEINDISRYFFGEIEGGKKFDFEIHFKRLGEFIRGRKDLLANEEEKKLINGLLTRLDCININNSNKGTFEDLKDGLHYFMKQKEESRSDWFVKNFEQIDGDILQSKHQNIIGENKVYHFACVSDLDMNRSVDELLPWPLSEMFIEKAYNPKDLQFQVYYAALNERSNFLRYELFYGLYFNQCDTEISFVKRYGDEVTDLYELLKIAGVKKETNTLNDLIDDELMTTIVKGKKISSIEYDRKQMADMFLCPYRYLLDYVLNGKPVVSGMFLIQKKIENILIENTWKVIQYYPQSKVKTELSEYISEEIKKIGLYIAFIRDTDVYDIQRRVENYIRAKVLLPENDNKNVRKFKSTHMELRKSFGDALFKMDLQDLPREHPYESFEKKTRIEDGKKIYSTHNIPPKEDKDLAFSMLEYINNSEDNMEIVGGWCNYCQNKSICLSPYVESTE